MPGAGTDGVWTILAGAVLVFWIGLLSDSKRRWPARWTLAAQAGAAPADSRGARVTVVIPARNEAAVLERSLPTLLAQGARFDSLFLVDDGSTDGTGRVARRVAAAHAAREKLRVIEARPPPPGWSGKLNALDTAVELEAEETRGRGEVAAEWLLFTDADILHPEDSVGRLLAQAAAAPYDLVSVMVRLSTASFWEKLLMPPFVYFFQLMYPFVRVSEPRSRVAAAAGGCILIRRALLERIGGLVSMHDAIIDDITLARRVKAAGGRLWLGSDPGMVSLRVYRHLGEIVDMVARTAFTELGYRYSLVPLTWLVLLVLFVAPPFLCGAFVATGELAAALLAGASWILETASVMPVVRHQRVQRWYALFLPVAAAVYAYITGVSAWRHFRGRGVRWRGRVHGAPEAKS